MIVRILSVSVRVGVFDPKGHGEVFFLDSQTIVSDFGLSGSSLPYGTLSGCVCVLLTSDCRTTVIRNTLPQGQNLAPLRSAFRETSKAVCTVLYEG